MLQEYLLSTSRPLHGHQYMGLLSIMNHYSLAILEAYWLHQIVFIISIWNLFLVLYRLQDCIRSKTVSKQESESPDDNKSTYPSLRYRKCWYHFASFQPSVSLKSSWPNYARVAIFSLQQLYCVVWVNFWKQFLDCLCISPTLDALGDTSFAHQIFEASQNLVHSFWYRFDRNVSFQGKI